MWAALPGSASRPAPSLPPAAAVRARCPLPVAASRRAPPPAAREQRPPRAPPPAVRPAWSRPARRGRACGRRPAPQRGRAPAEYLRGLPAPRRLACPVPKHIPCRPQPTTKCPGSQSVFKHNTRAARSEFVLSQLAVLAPKVPDQAVFGFAPSCVCCIPLYPMFKCALNALFTSFFPSPSFKYQVLSRIAHTADCLSTQTHFLPFPSPFFHNYVFFFEEFHLKFFNNLHENHTVLS